MYLHGIISQLLVYIFLILVKTIQSKQTFNKVADFNDIIEPNLNENLAKITTKSPFLRLIHLPFLRHKKETCACNDPNTKCDKCKERKKIELKKIGPEHYFLHLFEQNGEQFRRKRNITQDNLGVIDNLLKCIKYNENLNNFTMEPIVFGEVSATEMENQSSEIESDTLSESLTLSNMIDFNNQQLETVSESSTILNGPVKLETTIFGLVNSPENQQANAESKTNLQFTLNVDETNCEITTESEKMLELTKNQMQITKETVKFTSLTEHTVESTQNQTETLKMTHNPSEITFSSESTQNQTEITKETTIFRNVTENTVEVMQNQTETTKLNKETITTSYESTQNQPQAVEIAKDELMFHLPNITNIFCYINDTTIHQENNATGNLTKTTTSNNLTFSFTTNTTEVYQINENSTAVTVNEKNLVAEAENLTDQVKNHISELKQNILDALEHKNNHNRTKKNTKEHEIKAGILIYPKKKHNKEICKRDNKEGEEFKTKCSALLKDGASKKPKQHCMMKSDNELLDLLNNINAESANSNTTNVKLTSISLIETTLSSSDETETKNSIEMSNFDESTTQIITMYPEDEAKFLKTAKAEGLGNSLYSELPSVEETAMKPENNINFLTETNTLDEITEQEAVEMNENVSNEYESTEMEVKREEDLSMTSSEKEIKDTAILDKIHNLEDDLKLVNELQNVIDGVSKKELSKRNSDDDDQLTISSKVNVLGKILRFKLPKTKQQIRNKRFLIGKHLAKNKRNWKKLNERFLGRST